MSRIVRVPPVWNAYLSKSPLASKCLELVRFDSSALLWDGTALKIPLVCTKGATNVFGTMHGGLLMSLTEILTHLHVVCTNSAASVNPLPVSYLNTQFLRAITPPEAFTVISTLSHGSATIASRIAFHNCSGNECALGVVILGAAQ